MTRVPVSGSARSLRFLSAAVLFAGCAAAVPALAAPQPAQLTPTFKDRDGPSGSSAKDAPPCGLQFIEIADARRSPDVLGVIDRRAVLAPKDFQAWMKAVLGGLTARGVTAWIEGDASGVPGTRPARLTLQIASIQSTVVTYSASVVLKLEIEAGSDEKFERSYRGRVARTAYWSGGTDTLQSAVDGAFADALDEMATDLKGMCTA